MFREISPLDGRYFDRVKALGEFFSEHALMRERCLVELCFIEALDAVGLFPELTGDEKTRIRQAKTGLTEADFTRIKEIESEINHDVKACERFLRERLQLSQPNVVHFGLTSEDVNNLAYALILRRYRDQQQLPQLRDLVGMLIDLVKRWASIPFPARTHGQPASPTTLGKEFAVFLARLLRQAKQLEAFRFRGKLNGATGTYAALAVAFPELDWIEFTNEFVERLGLEPNLCTTQVEDGDALAEYFAIVARINSIVFDLDGDLWEYISREDLIEKAVRTEVGSSTMPHKVNPIRFENSEGNLTIANALLHTLSDVLTRSRMQRDLSGTTVKRNVGVALAHSYLAIDQTLEGLSRIDVDEETALLHLESSPEVLAEAYQTILRAAGIEKPYELLRVATRGKAITLADLHRWIDGLSLSDAVKQRLKGLRPAEYVGLAGEICDHVLAEARTWLDE
jgi:adenylosuccinate lyase